MILDFVLLLFSHFLPNPIPISILHIPSNLEFTLSWGYFTMCLNCKSPSRLERWLPRQVQTPASFHFSVTLVLQIMSQEWRDLVETQLKPTVLLGWFSCSANLTDCNSHRGLAVHSKSGPCSLALSLRSWTPGRVTNQELFLLFLLLPVRLRHDLGEPLGHNLTMLIPCFALLSSEQCGKFWGRVL